MQDKLRIAIVGAGEMGMVRGVMAKGLPMYELACIVDSRGTFARLAGKQFGVRHFSSYEKAASAEQFDAVVISTPLNSHHELGLKAVRDGKHVFCEKPLAGDSSLAIEMHREAAARGVKTQVGYNWRFHVTFSKAKEVIQKGVLGEPKYVRLMVYKSEVVRPEEKGEKKNREERFGFYGALAVHGLDLLLWFAGKPSSLSAQTTRVFSSGLSDLISAICRFDGGIHGVIDLGWSHHGFVDKDELSLHITGTEGSMVVNPDCIETYLERECGEFPCGDSLVYASELPYHTEFWFTHRGLSHEMEAFANAVIRDEKPAPSWYDGYLVDRLVEALEESGASGKPISPVIEESE
ncbi:MAG: Gfo/Idh/MocA family oxidoreductase [Candidatus Eiseniibacteriota bacterium]|nr:MAG: Gfo/Idh/MocA family oxidoreductase [Candidatus Eisenbacteria bacterium]